MFASFGMRRRRRRTQTPRNVLVLFMFAMMVISPIAANASVADEADAQRELMAQATEVPPEDPVAEPTEEPVQIEAPAPTEVPLPTEEPIGEQLGAFEIDYWECADGYDIANPDLENLFMDCEGVDDVLFELLASDGVPSSQLTGEFGDSHVSFTEIPTGMTSVTQPDSAGPISVFCNGIVQHGGPETGVMSVPVANDSIQWNLLDDEIVFCSWLTVPPQGPADLTVNKYACPEGYDVHAQDADPMIDCTEAIDGVTFIVTDDDPATFDIQTDTGDSQPGAVFFGGLAAGDYTIEETLPDNAESAFLWDCTIEDEDPSDPEDLPLNEGESWDFQMTGKDVECHWFNVPMAGVGPLQATEAPASPDVEGEQLGAFEIEYRECAAGYDVAGTETDTILMDCAQVNDVEFTIDMGGPGGNSQLTGEFGDSHVSFTEAPTGLRTITQTTPFAETYVTCNGIVQHGGPETGEMSMPVTSGAIEWNLLDDEIVFCNWFVGQGMAPATPTGANDNSVTVYKWDCPDGTTYGMDQDYYGAECATEHLNIPITLTDANGDHATTTQANGTQWDDVAPENGAIQIAEETPDGYGDPVVFCAPLDVDTFALIPSAGSMVSLTDFGQDTPWSLQCNWYNVPGDGSTVTVTKWECPEGTAYDQDAAWYQANCTELHQGIEFKLTHTEGVEYQTTGAGGMVEWSNVPLGPFSILEHIPPEYGEPIVFCGFTAFADGAVIDAFLQRVDAPGGYFEAELTIPATSYFCHWYNIPGGPGEITIIKYTCPEGYDLNAHGANPMDDCTEATNGVNFTLIDDDPGTVDLQTMTGDSIESAVYFGGLEPGPYTVIETVPADTWYVFVLDCYGQRMGELRPYPLEFGDTLDIHLSAGESIVCYWYNVPNWDPEYGRLTVYKLDCSTLTYVSDVDCEVYEGGKDFDLVFWNGSEWEYADTQTTDGFGKIMWFNLEPGEYWVDELGDDWCFKKSEQLSDDGNWLNVYDNQESVVNVYNCGGKDPGTPGKTPTKYPNTGAGPDEHGPLQELPAFAPLAGLLALLASRRAIRHSSGPMRAGARSTSSGQAPAGPYGLVTPEVPMTRTITRRTLAAALALPLGGTAMIRSGLFAQGDQVIEPFDGTPTEGTPASLCLTATPDAATPVDGSDCFRGAVPAGLTIASIGVDAPIEILETVGGVMQQPSDEVHVAWYKETARLGELGNILIAGHLNWWGVPEAVFFALGTLEEGAEVVLVDDEGDAYLYAVEWVRQESNLEPPTEEVLGMTDYESVTLITCGGEWDNSISEYDERTVARARRIAASGTPEAV